MISLYAQINRPIGHLPFLSLSLFLSLFLSFIPFQLQIPGKSFSIRTNTKHSSINEKFVSKLFISTKNFSFPKRKICRRKRNNVIFVNVHRENGGIERKEGTLEARSRSITRETGKGIAEYGRIFPSLFCPRPPLEPDAIILFNLALGQMDYSGRRWKPVRKSRILFSCSAPAQLVN